MRISERLSTPIEVSESDARLGIVNYPIAILFSLFRALGCWYRVSALRLLVAELGSLYHRSAAVLEIRAWELRGHKGIPRILSGWTPLVGSRHYRRACIQYMQQMHTRHSFLSILDLFLLEQTWRAGAEWGGHICTEQNQEVWGSSLTSIQYSNGVSSSHETTTQDAGVRAIHAGPAPHHPSTKSGSAAQDGRS